MAIDAENWTCRDCKRELGGPEGIRNIETALGRSGAENLWDAAIRIVNTLGDLRRSLVAERLQGMEHKKNLDEARAEIAQLKGLVHD
jgi:hypothetical protein